MTATLACPTRSEAKRVPVLVNRSSPVPLYHQLAEQLARAIEDGLLQPGELLEPEVSLADRLDMSRPTVRRSIAELVTRGLLVRRRGVGSTVAHAAVHRRIELTSLHDDLVADRHEPATRVLRLGYAEHNKRAARALDIDPRTPLVYVERLRLSDGVPIAILRNWLPPSCGSLSASELESDGLYSQLRRRGITPAVAHQTLGSRPAGQEERTLLGLGRHDPVLTMTRRAFDSAGAPFEFGDHSYRADRYSFDVTVRAL